MNRQPVPWNIALVLASTSLLLCAASIVLAIVSVLGSIR